MSIPWTFKERPDTRTTNVRLGIWLFLASETMLFGSLFSGYVLLRSGAAAWPDSEVLNLRHALMMTPVLVAATMVFSFKGRSKTSGHPEQVQEGVPNDRARLLGSAVLFAAFVGMKLLDYGEKISLGLLPSTNLLLGCWFALTGVHALHVVGGIAANIWASVNLGLNPERDRERFAALRLYWYFVDLVWVAILVGFYLL